MSYKHRNATSGLCFVAAAGLATLAVFSGFKSMQYGYNADLEPIKSITKVSDIAPAVSTIGHNATETFKGFAGQVLGDGASWASGLSVTGTVIMLGLGILTRDR